MAIRTEEGFVQFHGHRTWYREIGETAEGQYPLLVLHGGPGMPHDYLEPLEDMARTGRKVVFYDQLGCGRSDHIDDPELWTVDLFLDELRTVREERGLDRAHILGQSWGSMLALEHSLAGARGIESLVLCDPLVDTPQWLREADRLREQLPREVRETLLRHERAGTTDSPEYQAAMLVYYRRHVCRLDPWPEHLERSLAQFVQDPGVYNALWGSSEFFVTGRLKEWSILHRLGEISVPTLLMSGRFDEATPEIVSTIHRGIPGSEWVLFEESSHMPHAEERERFMNELDRFLCTVEGRSPRR